jgi:hypothetical protein
VNLPTLHYSHETMVQLMIDHPDYTHAELSAHFGKPANWLYSVLASEGFQMVLAPRKHEVLDPFLTASMEERFRMLAMQSVNLLAEKMETGEVSDFLVLKAAEIGVKALGMGMRPVEVPALPAPATSTQSVADRLLAAMEERDKRRTYEGEAMPVKDA